MGVRTKLLAFGKLTAASAVIYTAPSGETVIVKELDLYNGHSATQTLTISIVNPGSTVEVFGPQVSVAQFTPYQFIERWMVLQAGYTLKLYQSLGADARYAISGTELEGEAD